MNAASVDKLPSALVFRSTQDGNGYRLTHAARMRHSFNSVKWKTHVKAEISQNSAHAGLPFSWIGRKMIISPDGHFSPRRSMYLVIRVKCIYRARMWTRYPDLSISHHDDAASDSGT